MHSTGQMSKMLKSQKQTVFYRQAECVTEVKAGFLHKSPPTKTKQWKMRYFVLSRLDEDVYAFKYYKNKVDRDKALGEINLSQISVLNLGPEDHPKWSWVERIHKCSPSCVLYIKAADRDYFLVGQDSVDVDSWFSALFKAQEKRPQKVLNPEELSNGPGIKVMSKPLQNKKSCPPAHDKGMRFEATPAPECSSVADKKFRSLSDPSSNTLSDNSDEETTDVYKNRRRASEPVNPIYDYPKSYLRSATVESMMEGNKETNSCVKEEGLYESMAAFRYTPQMVEEVDSEVERFTDGSLMRDVTQAFEKLKTQISPLPSFDEEPTTDDREEMQMTPDFSSNSSDNGAVSPIEMLEQQNRHSFEKQSSTESIDNINIDPEERDIVVSRADLKKHLTLTEVDGKPSVSAWTGQSQTLCHFHKGDRILAVNDVHTSSVDEFNLYLSKILKNEVKLTLLCLPGCQPLHSAIGLCSE
ncbi:hypothetical protein LDENG_00102940 [Lucifuga dentata]|nr:hypothetical protein LDENG_00102940 [Lucifuga dentata]